MEPIQGMQRNRSRVIHEIKAPLEVRSTDSTVTLFANHSDYSLDQFPTGWVQARFENISLFQNIVSEVQVDEKGLEEWAYNHNHPTETNSKIVHLCHHDSKTPSKNKRAQLHQRFSPTLAGRIEISLEKPNLLNNN